MEAVATTGLYPEANQNQHDSEIDPKYGLMPSAVRRSSSGTPNDRASYPQADQQQVIYRGTKTARSTPNGQVMSYGSATRPFESAIIKRDELGK